MEVRMREGGQGSRQKEGLVTRKERDGPVSQWDPVEHRPDRAAGRAGHCPDTDLATPWASRLTDHRVHSYVRVGGGRGNLSRLHSRTKVYVSYV